MFADFQVFQVARKMRHIYIEGRVRIKKLSSIFLQLRLFRRQSTRRKNEARRERFSVFVRFGKGRYRCHKESTSLYTSNAHTLRGVVYKIFSYLGIALLSVFGSAFTSGARDRLCMCLHPFYLQIYQNGRLWLPFQGSVFARNTHVNMHAAHIERRGRKSYLNLYVGLGGMRPR